MIIYHKKLKQWITTKQLYQLFKNIKQMSDKQQNPIDLYIKAINEDLELKLLYEQLNKLIRYESPKYILNSNGEFNILNSDFYNVKFKKLTERIEQRNKELLELYNI